MAPSLPGRTRNAPSSAIPAVGVSYVSMTHTLAPFLRASLSAVEKMDVCSRCIDAPQDHQIALRGLIRVRGRCVAHDGPDPCVFGRRAYSPVQPGSAQTVKKGMAGVSLNKAHGACVRVGKDRLGPASAMISRQRLEIRKMASGQEI